ncbi:Calcium-binding EF hand family protein [Forsythia ovata]|uniref:Calcium-binding EF hand family protein n=1 Tax=Forsythia ovata TaxID=205694 RepID=A0ABD1UAY5_9LAMI
MAHPMRLRPTGFDEPGLGSFDTHYDTDAAWDFNTNSTKDADYERHRESSLFISDGWVINPIRTGSTGTEAMLPKQGPLFDSVPSTPIYNSASTTHGKNIFQRKSPFAFADSVPSTPMYSSSNSPRRFDEGSEEHYSFDSFSRFDSFNMNETGPFSSRPSFSRFDSMRSTRDSEFYQGYFAPRKSLARFDSFHSMADSDYNFGPFLSHDSLTRIDSMRSTRDSDYNFGSVPPRDSFMRFDSMRNTRDSDYSRGFPSFDDEADPFGSNEQF